MDPLFSEHQHYTSSLINPTSTQDPITNMSPLDTIDPSQTTNTTIKMEDLHVSFATPPPSAPSMSGSPPPSTQSEGKQVKKRKSWGQVLPEPKTSLPPRKRAKTEDEKEQRRIERVKRNRLAAHNSRERKRQEYEVLQAEKDQLEADLVAARQTIVRMNAELAAYRQKYPNETIPQTTFDLATPPSSDVTSNPSNDTIDPSQTTSSSFPSPVSMTIDSMDSPRDSSCQPETPSFNEATPDFDQTRYPAEILCDLQCRSKSTASLQAIWAFLTLFNLTLPSTMESLSTPFSTSTSSQTPLWNQLLAFWTATSFSQPPSSTNLIPALIKLIFSMQSTSICRQPLAQLTLATGLSQRRTSIDQVARSFQASRSAGHEGVARQRRLRSFRLRQMGDRRKRTSWALRRGITRALARNQEALNKTLAVGV